MRQFFTIPGILPDLNTEIDAAKRHWNFYRSTKEAWTLSCKQHARKLEPIKGRVIFSFLWVAKNKRKDPDNICFAKKYILDGLVAAGILPTDGWNHVSGFRDEFDISPDNPRTIVTLELAED